MSKVIKVAEKVCVAYHLAGRQGPDQVSHFQETPDPHSLRKRAES